jgi:hypothetical protein
MVNIPANASAAVIAFNSVMADLSENYEPFIQKATISQPRFWFDRIPRAAYQLFSGASKSTNIFRGGLVHYAGLAHWDDIQGYDTEATAVNPCAPMAPVTYGYSWERLAWAGKKMAWASDSICQDMFRFTAQAQQQLAWILQAGVDFGFSHLEVWNRDNYIFAAVQSGRAFVMTPGGARAAVTEQFYYNPYHYGVAPTYLHTKPFVLFPVGNEVNPLNFDELDYMHDALAVRAPGSGIGNEGGNPIYGLPISMRDFEKYVKGNKAELEAWRQAQPSQLINGYGMLMKNYRQYAMVEDTNQLRFKVLKIVTAAAANACGITTFGSSASTKLFLAEYQAPRKLGRPGTNGVGVPEENPDYIQAELAISPIFMNDIMVNQFVPETPGLGSGTSFGPTTGLNGSWGWRNIQTPDTNPEMKIGNFYGKYEIFPKPGMNFVNATAFLYKRCTQSLTSLCPVNIDDRTASAALLVSTDVTAAAAGQDLTDATTGVITIKLTKALDATIGSQVSIAVLSDVGDAGEEGVIYGVILEDSDAATYVVSITDLNGALGFGTTPATDFTSANFPANGAVTVL